MDQCGIQCMEADLLDRGTLHEPLDMVDVIYSLAFPSPLASKDELLTFINVGLKNLLEEANEHGVKTVVHLSCLDVYGKEQGRIGTGTVPKPADEYQTAMLNAERLLEDFSSHHTEMKVRIVRSAPVVGARDMVLTASILKMIERGKVVLPQGSSSTMSFSHPKDVAQSLLKVATHQTEGSSGALLVKSYDSTLNDLALAIVSAVGKKAEVKQAGLLSGKSLVPSYVADQIAARRVLDGQSAWANIAYAPAYDVKKTADEVAEWYRREPWATKDLG